MQENGRPVFEGFIGTEQRLSVVVVPGRVAEKWSEAAFEEAMATLDADERTDGVVSFDGASALVVDVVAGACGVFQAGPRGLTLIGHFPKVDSAQAIASGFATEAAVGPSTGAAKLGELLVGERELVVMNANITAASDEPSSLPVTLEPGLYDVWGENYELRGAWGLAEVRIRVVPHGQGIVVGARIDLP